MKKKIGSILFTIPNPENENSPYIKLGQQYGIKTDFYPFIRVEDIPIREFRAQRIDITKYKSLLLTSKHSIDHYFKIAELLRYEVPSDTKYYCSSESIALYLQKHIRYRKRKIFFGTKGLTDLLPFLEKYPNEPVIAPSTNVSFEDTFKPLTDLGHEIIPVTFFKTCFNDLSVYKDITYDMIVFYSPLSVLSLFHNFPDFKKKNTILVAYGSLTQKIFKEKRLKLDIKVPTKKYPSVGTAIEDFINNASK